MAFNDLECWWPTFQKKRPQPHEGIDFFCYEDSLGKVHYLTQHLVPAPCHGRVVALCPDFLGRSVFLQAEKQDGKSGMYVLAHISPHVHVGQILNEGDGVGEVAAVKGDVPAHLHVSFLQGDWRDLPEKLSWSAILAQKKLRFVRPFSE